MKTMKLVVLGTALGAALTLLPSTAGAAVGIVGSLHDFYSNTNAWLNGSPSWISGTRTNVCGECHTIHHAPDPQNGPLWIHAMSQQTYKTYAQAGSDTFDALGLTVALGSSSKACLSCHDGTVGINQQTSLIAGPSGVSTNQTLGGTPIYATDVIIPINNNDLTHMHPIGVSYTAAQGALPAGELKATTGTFPNTSGSPTIGQMLKGVNHTMECSSCHDIHRTRGNAPNSGIYTVASGQNLCLGCHNK
jgi:predicted CXXCH cytochrome family protein